jgi:hypothetical protein
MKKKTLVQTYNKKEKKGGITGQEVLPLQTFIKPFRSLFLFFFLSYKFELIFFFPVYRGSTFHRVLGALRVQHMVEREMTP